MDETVKAEDRRTPLYNLKAVVKETDLKPSTIRAWERRYGMPQPRRTMGGHRQYSQRDIETLNWLVARQQEGMSISHAAKLWRVLNEEGHAPTSDLKSHSVTGPLAAAAAPTSAEIAKLRREWIDACLAFDRIAAERVLVRAFALFPPEVACVQLLQAGLSEIGEGWYRGEVTIQQEHFASAMSVQRLEILIAGTPPPTRPERIIVASAEDDFHVFSPLLLTFLLRRRGLDVLYIGADMPVAALRETAVQVKPQMVIVSAQTLSTATSLIDAAAALEGEETVVGYGGIIFNMMPQLRERIAAHYLGPTIEGAVPVVERLLRQPGPHEAPTVLDQSYSVALRQFKQRRSLIEAHLWNAYISSARNTETLAQMNHELAGIITAALIFGDEDILGRELAWDDYLMKNYTLSEAEAHEYLATYAQAAEIHLDGPAQVIADRLFNLSAE